MTDKCWGAEQKSNLWHLDFPSWHENIHSRNMRRHQYYLVRCCAVLCLPLKSILKEWEDDLSWSDGVSPMMGEPQGQFHVLCFSPGPAGVKCQEVGWETLEHPVLGVCHGLMHICAVRYCKEPLFLHLRYLRSQGRVAHYFCAFPPFFFYLFCSTQQSKQLLCLGCLQPSR